MCYREKYVEELRELIVSASPKALAICRVWNNEHFGQPGHGGVAYVAQELAKAEKAVAICESFVDK